MNENISPDNDAVLPARINQRYGLFAGLGFGIAADILLWSEGPAVSGFALWTLVLAVYLNIVNKVNRTLNPAHVCFWTCIAVCAAILMVLRSNVFMIALLWFVILTATAMLVCQRMAPVLSQWKIRDVISAFISMALNTLFAAMPILYRAELHKVKAGSHFTAACRGLLLLLPLAVIFTALFAMADNIFERSVAELFHWLSDDMLLHIIRALLFSWLSIGLIYVLTKAATKALPTKAVQASLGTTETIIVLGGLCCLFGIFVMIQLGYLFGGNETIINTSGLTVAAYARRGFFELLLVTGLALTVLLALSGRCINRKLFCRLASVLLCCVVVIQLSAVQRLTLYISEFGLTIERLIAASILFWLLIVLLIFFRSIIKNRPTWFLYCSISSAALIALILAAANPAAIVARINIRHSINTGSNLDTSYLLKLGSDAIPAMFDSFEQMPPLLQCKMATGLRAQQPRPMTNDFRRFNYSLWQAGKLLDKNRNRISVTANDALKDLLPPVFTGQNFIAGCIRPVGSILYQFGPLAPPAPFNQAQQTR